MLKTKPQEFDDEPRRFFSDMHDAVAAIRSEAHMLDRLASAFHATGNEKVADKIDGCANRLSDLAQRVFDSIGEKVYADMRESERSMLNTVEAAIAGLTFSARSAEKP